MKLIGKGLILEPKVPDYGDVEIDFDVSIGLPRLPSSIVVNAYSAASGRIAWFDLNADLLAAVTSGALSTGTVARAEAEPHQVPVEPPYEVELVEGPLVPFSEIVIGDDNWRLRRTEAKPGPDEYAFNGRKLTVHAARSGLYVYADYFYSDAGGGKTVVVNPFAFGAEFKLLASVRLYDDEDGTYERQIIIAANRCQIKAPLWACSPEEVPAGFGFKFEIGNRIPGDVVVHFP